MSDTTYPIIERAPAVKRVYLSGPMTGLPNSNFPAFNAAARQLRALDFDVVNPVDINPDPGAPWHECMRKDLAELLTCDTLVLLEGWQRSQGAHLEMHVAHRVGMQIVTMDELIAFTPDLAGAAAALVHRAEREGKVLTIEQHSLHPPAMGRHETRVHVRDARR